MTGPHADQLASMARDVRWALDALRAGESEMAERILTHCFETYVLIRAGEPERLAQRANRM